MKRRRHKQNNPSPAKMDDYLNSLAKLYGMGSKGKPQKQANQGTK
jgi:hypothetical protein